MSVSPPTNGHESAGRDDRAREPRGPVTLRDLGRMASRGEPFAALACYDATTARWLERAGVHLLLAGDSAAQVVLGMERTIEAPLEFMIQITAAVKRGAPNTPVMADMPFLTCHASHASALRCAGRFMTEGKADIVKVEANASMGKLIAKMTTAGIPVCAHVGFRPQTTGLEGVPTAKGRTADDAARIVADAVALEDAGAVMILVEAVPPEVTGQIVEKTRVPVIGIGAGVECHGQILVVNDLLGMTDTPPRFAEPAETIGERIRDAGREWVRRVGSRDIGGRTYAMREGEAQRLADGVNDGAPRR